MAHEYTQKEVQKKFMEHMVGLVRYWDGVKPDKALLEDSGVSESMYKLEGLLHSILVTLDGRNAGMPAFEVIPSPHPDDKKFHKDKGSNWWPPTPKKLEGTTTVHGRDMLHELVHDYFRKTP